MSSELAKIIADFTTSLATKISVGGETATLLSATDDDAVALPAGKYFFTIDGDNSQKEHISCTLSGTSLTGIKTVARGTAIETVGVLREHRVGASVTITDFAHIKKINDLLDGTTDLDATNPLKYDADPTITDDKELATKKYADDLAIGGSPKSTEAVYGITRLSTAAASAVAPIAVGDNDTRVPTQGENDALVGDNTDVAVGTGNKFITQTGLQHNAEKYAADAQANDTYVITLSPAPTSYTNGMVVYFYAKTINTGAATLNVNGLGAKTIVKHLNTTLIDGDIVAGQLNTVIYDGTNFVLQSPVARTVSTDAAGKLPALDGSQLTGILKVATASDTSQYTDNAEVSAGAPNYAEKSFTVSISGKIRIKFQYKQDTDTSGTNVFRITKDQTFLAAGTTGYYLNKFISGGDPSVTYVDAIPTDIYVQAGDRLTIGYSNNNRTHYIKNLSICFTVAENSSPYITA